MKQIKLPKTEKLAEELFELNLQNNVLRRKIKEKLEEISETKKEEGCFKDILWDIEPVRIYVDFTKEEDEKIKNKGVEAQAKRIFDFFKRPEKLNN